MENPDALKIRDRVRIVEYSDNTYIGKTGIIEKARRMEVIKRQQVINEWLNTIPLDNANTANEILCIVKLDDTDERIEVLLSGLLKV